MIYWQTRKYYYLIIIVFHCFWLFLFYWSSGTTIWRQIVNINTFEISAGGAFLTSFIAADIHIFANVYTLVGTMF